MTDSSSLLTVIAAVALFVWWYRTRDQHPQQDGDNSVGVRELDYVLVVCDHPEHHPERIPSAPVRARHVGLDVRDMDRNGWGSTEHTQLCNFHNQGQYPLNAIHVVCGQPGCTTRTQFPAGDPEVGIGGVRNAGWCNDRQVPICPYCAGTRSRTWR